MAGLVPAISKSANRALLNEIAATSPAMTNRPPRLLPLLSRFDANCLGASKSSKACHGREREGAQTLFRLSPIARFGCRKRGHAMAQYDREYFKKQFEGLPPNATAMIALRAAMRVFPVLARRSKAADPAFRFWTVAHSGRHTLAVCRSFQSLAFSLTNGSPAVSGRAFVDAGRYVNGHCTDLTNLAALSD